MTSRQLILEQEMTELPGPQAGGMRRSPLELAAQTASTSYARPLPPEVLRDALLTGQMPDEFAPHIGTLLEEAPISLLVKVVEQLNAENEQPWERVWAVMEEFARQQMITRELRPIASDGA